MKLLANTSGKAFKVNGNGLKLVVPSGYQVLAGIKFDGKVWYETALKLKGSDTMKVSFLITKACNVLGCYTSTSAQNNYSIYASTSSGAKYLRYNGGTYNSYLSTNTRYDVIVTPTGCTGMRTDSTWTEKTFVADSFMCIGTTSLEATSAKLTGNMYGPVEIVGRGYFVPVERTSDNEIGYYELYSGTFIENDGTGTPVAITT